MALDKRLKENWIIALRSGEYLQTRGAFRRKDSFCCLSVLAHQLGYESATNKVSDTGELNLVTEGLISQKSHIKFVRANDIERLTFDEIADRIEDGRLKC